MSFCDKLKEYENFDFEAYLENVRNEDIKRILYKENLNEMDFLTLLSKKAENYLEPMAQRARELSIKILVKQWYYTHLCIWQIIVKINVSTVDTILKII